MPIRRQLSTSSSQISSARRRAAATRASRGRLRTAARISSSAQRRFTPRALLGQQRDMTVERLVGGVLAQAEDDAVAAVAPISGAPRTCIVAIARAASSTERRRATTSSCGRRAWSMISTLASSSPSQIVR